MCLNTYSVEPVQLIKLQKTSGETPGWLSLTCMWDHPKMFLWGNLVFWGKWNWNPTKCVDWTQALLEQDNPGMFSIYRCYIKGAENSETRFKVPGRRNGNVLCWKIWLGLISGNLATLCYTYVSQPQSGWRSESVLTWNRNSFELPTKWAFSNLNAL